MIDGSLVGTATNLEVAHLLVFLLVDSILSDEEFLVAAIAKKGFPLLQRLAIESTLLRLLHIPQQDAEFVDGGQLEGFRRGDGRLEAFVTLLQRSRDELVGNAAESECKKIV